MKKVVFRRKKVIDEEGAVGGGTTAGGGAIAGIGVPSSDPSKPLNWSEPGVSKNVQKKHRGNVLRRSPPQALQEAPSGMFAGSPTFIVPSSVFHEARLQKRKGAHWKTYIGEDDHYSHIREYARKNPKKSIVLQDEKTGALCYARYGGKEVKQIDEVEYMPGIQKGEKFDMRTGDEMTKSTRSRSSFVADVGRNHHIIHDPIRDSYHMIHKKTGRIETSLHGVSRRNGVYGIDTLDSEGTPGAPKAHHFYKALLQSKDIEGNPRIKALMTDSQSEGGKRVWQKLSKMKGIHVHGYDPETKKGVSVDLRDDDETHELRFPDIFPSDEYDPVKKKHTTDLSSAADATRRLQLVAHTVLTKKVIRRKTVK